MCREDVEPICHAIRDWKLLARTFELKESRISDYEEEAKDIGAEPAKIARWDVFEFGANFGRVKKVRAKKTVLKKTGYE